MFFYCQIAVNTLLIHCQKCVQNYRVESLWSKKDFTFSSSQNYFFFQRKYFIVRMQWELTRKKNILRL